MAVVDNLVQQDHVMLGSLHSTETTSPLQVNEDLYTCSYRKKMIIMMEEMRYQKVLKGHCTSKKDSLRCKQMFTSEDKKVQIHCM